MNFKITFITSVIFVLAFLTACGSSGPTNSANSANSANSNAVIVNTANANAVAVSTPTPDAITNNAPTLTPVYKAYCAAMVKKDEAAVRKLYSKDTIQFFESEMKADGIKTLTEYLSTDQVTNELCEVSNERITGERAIGKIKSKGYPNGMDVVFVKENGEWKLTVDDVNKK